MVKNVLKTVFAKTVKRTVKGRQQQVVVPPSEKLLYAVYFSLGMVGCLTALEIVHLLVLGSWNSEVFTAIAGLIGNITGIFLTQKT